MRIDVVHPEHSILSRWLWQRGPDTAGFSCSFGRQPLLQTREACSHSWGIILSEPQTAINNCHAPPGLAI
jgi:hypothetical protein